MQFMICSGGSLGFVLGTFITWRTLAIVGKVVCLDVPIYNTVIPHMNEMLPFLLQEWHHVCCSCLAFF
jgi:hypothetical protein